MRCRSLPVTLRSLQVLISMIDDISSGQPIKAMQPKAPKTANGGGMNPNNAFPSPGMGGVVPGPFGAGPGGNPNAMYNGNAGYMTQQPQHQQYGMPQQQQYGMQPQMGYQRMQPQMGYQQMQPQMGYQQQMMQQPQQHSNGPAFL